MFGWVGGGGGGLFHYCPALFVPFNPHPFYDQQTSGWDVGFEI